MTTPTQAQIEAAAKELCKSWPKVPDGCAALCMDRLGCIPKEGCHHAVTVHGKRAEAALTAAAQVTEQEKLQRDRYFSHNHVFKNGRCIACDIAEKQWNEMFAAAQVGGNEVDAGQETDEAGRGTAQLPMPEDADPTSHKSARPSAVNRDSLAASTLATIERCAQVAEEYVEKYHHNGKRAAAVIRKLMDNPPDPQKEKLKSHAE